MSAGFILSGSIFQRNGVAVGEVTNVGPPKATRETADVTAMDTADQYRDHIPGLKDNDDMSLSIVYVPTDAQQLALAADFEAGTKQPFGFVFPDAGSMTVTFNALVTAWGVEEGGPGDPAMLAIGLKPIGKAVWTQ